MMRALLEGVVDALDTDERVAEAADPDRYRDDVVADFLRGQGVHVLHVQDGCIAWATSDGEDETGPTRVGLIARSLEHEDFIDTVGQITMVNPLAVEAHHVFDALADDFDSADLAEPNDDVWPESPELDGWTHHDIATGEADELLLMEGDDAP